jgi:hypothetical protein
MAGVSGHSGAVKRTIFSWVTRLSLGPGDADLLPFFEGLKKLPAGKRNRALLAAIRGGAEAASRLMASEDDELAESAGEFLV